MFINLVTYTYHTLNLHLTYTPIYILALNSDADKMESARYKYLA